jgi:hypothetical protein
MDQREMQAVGEALNDTLADRRLGIGDNRPPRVVIEVLAVDVPIAGAMAGLSRVRSYAAAKDGSMPTIKVAGRLKVPLRRWRAKLNGEAP